MNQFLSVFQIYLIETKKSSANTVESYLRDLNRFVSYCSAKNCFAPNEVSADFLRGYLDSLKAEGKSESTLTRIIASVRCFYRYLIANHIVSENPADAVRMKKSMRELPSVLNQNEVMALLAQPSGSDYKSIRDKAMLELLYATGITVTELIELEADDINLQIGMLHMQKSRHERIIPIYPAAVRVLQNYMQHVRPILISSERERHLFTNMNGQPLSRQGFWKIIKFYAEKAGIAKDITPHTLRHSFAAHLLENGAQLKDIKEMLGHSDISSTQIYARFVKNKYAQAYSRFHPLAK
ncbi:MAG: tyrosine recombinase [Clostridia bacterium]|nr:tyrosine recombinase [Clostridia bacterium]